jgi:hypothetical protein
MTAPFYPSLYQINIRVWLTALSRELGRPATLDDLPDAELDKIAELGLDWVWLLSVWQTGLADQRISRTRSEWRNEFEETLPDLTDDDIAGSGFAITAYEVHQNLGGNDALLRLRDRLRLRNLRLMLDFVPNHTALDHPWTRVHPDYFILGSLMDDGQVPYDYCWVATPRGDQLFAHGRDPNFPGWPDTLQLNYANPELQEAMIGELLRIADLCDGVRCDMAMLILPDVFERTWDLPCKPFWGEATHRVREKAPNFLFVAEVYWDLEWTLQQQGFDWTYDKRLYDRLRDQNVWLVRGHLKADMDFQTRLARFLENHDEPRAAVTFPGPVHEAAAVITYLVPGLRFFHQGQLEGHRKRISPHLIRSPVEPLDEGVQHFYHRLLKVLRLPAVRNGTWQPLEGMPIWEGDSTWANFIAFAWDAPGCRLIVAVNYSPRQSQCYVRLPWSDLAGHRIRLDDLLQPVVYDREGEDLLNRGLYLDVPGWGYHVFSVVALS